MIQVTTAINHIERTINPAQHKTARTELEQLDAIDRLHDSWLTIGPACEAVRLITGTELSQNTVRTWERRGKIEARGEPMRFHIRDLEALQKATPLNT